MATIYISSGQTLSGETLDRYSYTTYIISGGHAEDTVVNTDGVLYISHKGTAENTTVNSGGVMYVRSRGIANSTTVNSGGVISVSSGGTATNIIWTPCVGDLTVFEGAYVTYASRYRGVYFGSDSNLLSHAETMSDKTVSGSMYVMDNGVAKNTTVSAGAKLFVSSGGQANHTSIYSGGYAYVRSGGSMNDTVVFPHGMLVVSNGGTAINNFISEWGTVYVYGAVSNTTVDTFGCLLAVSSGGTTENTTVNSGGEVLVGNGGLANNTTINADGSMSVTGIANDTVLSGGTTYSCCASMSVSLNGSANNVSAIGNTAIVAAEGGKITNVDLTGSNGRTASLKISQGGVVSGVNVNNLGYVAVSYGGILNSAVLNKNGKIDVFKGGIVSNTILNTDISLAVHGSAYAYDTVISSGRMYLDSSSIGKNTVIHSGGTMTIRKGTAVDTTVNSGGIMYISSGGTAQNTIVSSGGYLTIHSSGTHRGTLQTEKGATVILQGDAVIDFTVAGQSVYDSFLINDFSCITGPAVYTITVSSNQEMGTYKLAQNAQRLSATMTVSDKNKAYGKLTVNGTGLVYNEKVYLLDCDNGNLTLTIKEKNPDPDAKLLSNGVSQILAWDKEQGKVGYLATDGNKAPQWQGIWEWNGTDAELWRVAGVGHFKGTEVDYDGILLYNGIGNRFAAWTDLGRGSYGYVDLCKVDGSFSTECLVDLDGNEYDDILIYDDNGSIGVVLDGISYKDIWHVSKGESEKWELVGAGSFDDGADKLVMVNNENNFVYLWTNNDSAFSSWNWSQCAAGKLEDGWEVAAVGDFDGDGIDDIMVIDTNTNNVWVWDDGNSQTKRWRGTLGAGFEIEAVGDYNGDGKDDLLLREYNTGWGGLGYWAAGYAGNWVDLNARIETDLKSSFDIIA